MLPPPPRRIRPTHSKRGLRFIGRLLVLAVFLVTLAFTLALASELALRFLGNPTIADVASIHERPNGSSYAHWARYTYTASGQPPHTDESRINYDAFRKLREPFLDAGTVSNEMIYPPKAPGKLAVYSYAFGPLIYSRAIEHEWGPTVLVISAIFAPACAFLLYALYLAIIIRPRRYRRIFSHGIEVPGTIVDTYEDQATDSYYYAIRFAYTPLGEDKPRICESPLPGPKEFKTATIGQQVTALYDPKNPRKAATYEYGGFTGEV
jgi:hypothetical protein